MQRTILRGIIFWLWLPALVAGAGPAAQSSPQTPEGLFSQIQGLLQKKDFPGYLDLFAPDLRSGEKDRLETFFKEFGMESVKLRLVGKRTGDEAGTRLYCQAYFQNAFSVMIESWQFTAAAREGRWEIVGKETSGNISKLYKIKIPAERAERVRSVEILHRDIRLSFTGAAVFYDNIPGVDTALLIIGKGTVRFSPSDRIEKHQMELLYKKPFLEDDIDYVYVRCSNSLAASNIRIGRGDGEPAVTQPETDRAAALFARNYPRSFTIESSVDKEILSFLPQGEEAVFDFRGKR
ncbi:MAG: M1 family aminopeptidase, partial [Candidatus Aminicenantales bacterium]